MRPLRSSAFGIIIAGVAFGSAIGDGIVASKAVEAIARQPEARPNIFTFLFLGVGVLEAFPIIALGLGFYLLLVVANVPSLITHLHDTLGNQRHTMFLQLDGTLLVQLINFAIFFAMLNVMFLRPVGRAIRQAPRVHQQRDRGLRRYQAEAKALRAQAEDVRLAARRQAEATIAKARADASNQAAQLATDYNAQAQCDDRKRPGNGRKRAGSGARRRRRGVKQLADLMVSVRFRRPARC